jgi:LysM repeat protein
MNRIALVLVALLTLVFGACTDRDDDAAAGTSTSMIDSTPETTSVDEPADEPENEPSDEPSDTIARASFTHTIVEGEFLRRIADTYEVEIDDIVAANGWSDGRDHLLLPGQEIFLPADATAPTTTPPASESGDAEPSDAEPSDADSPSTIDVTYTVVVPAPCDELAADPQFDAFHAGADAFIADVDGTRLAVAPLGDGAALLQKVGDPPETEEEYCTFSTAPQEVPVEDAYTGGVVADQAGTWGRATSYDLTPEHVDAGAYELVAYNFN